MLQVRLSYQNGLTDAQVATIISVAENGWQAMEQARLTYERGNKIKCG